MNAKRNKEIKDRWQEIDRQLAELPEGDERRGPLLLELDELDYELGEDYLENR